MFDRLWTSGDIRQGGLIPLESQVINTCPANFIWEEDVENKHVTCVANGLYEISFGVHIQKITNLNFNLIILIFRNV